MRKYTQKISNGYILSIIDDSEKYYMKGEGYKGKQYPKLQVMVWDEENLKEFNKMWGKKDEYYFSDFLQFWRNVDKKRNGGEVNNIFYWRY